MNWRNEKPPRLMARAVSVDPVQAALRLQDRGFVQSKYFKAFEFDGFSADGCAEDLLRLAKRLVREFRSRAWPLFVAVEAPDGLGVDHAHPDRSLSVAEVKVISAVVADVARMLEVKVEPASCGRAHYLVVIKGETGVSPSQMGEN